MSPFDGTPRNKAWETPRGLKVFGGPGADPEHRTSSPLPPDPYHLPPLLSPSPKLNPLLFLRATVAANRSHVLRSYAAKNLTDILKDWYKNRLIEYNTELVHVCGKDMNAIFAQYASEKEQAVRREMESIGYTREVLRTWGMIGEEEDLIDDFEPCFM